MADVTIRHAVVGDRGQTPFDSDALNAEDGVHGLRLADLRRPGATTPARPQPGIDARLAGGIAVAP